MRRKQVTIKDIARELDLSQMTVSRALSPDPKTAALVTQKTRARIRKLAADLGYTPNLMARGFVTGRTNTLGLLTCKINCEPFGRQADMILRAADRQDYQILVALAASPSDAPEDRSRQIHQMISRGVDGLLIHARGTEGESELILQAVKGRVPVVTFFHPSTPDLCGVALDDGEGIFEATSHLIRRGHERIGFIGTDWTHDCPAAAKARGYFRAMEMRGLAPEHLPSPPPMQAAYELGKAVADRFTAFVCRSDLVAIGLCRGLQESGLRVPEDVAVVGCGDLDVSAYSTPALTTLAIPYDQIAEAAMDLMLEQLHGDATPRQVTLTHRLIVRDSCG